MNTLDRINVLRRHFGLSDLWMGFDILQSRDRPKLHTVLDNLYRLAGIEITPKTLVKGLFEYGSTVGERINRLEHVVFGTPFRSPSVPCGKCLPTPLTPAYWEREDHPTTQSLYLWLGGEAYVQAAG